MDLPFSSITLNSCVNKYFIFLITDLFVTSRKTRGTSQIPDAIHRLCEFRNKDSKEPLPERTKMKPIRRNVIILNLKITLPFFLAFSFLLYVIHKNTMF